MKSFNEKRKEANNVFFENYNFLKCYDFMYDFKNDELIPCYEKCSSHDSYVSFREYATVFDTDDLFYLIENVYDDEEIETSIYISRCFYFWFEKFYNNITNTEYPTTLYGEYIHAEYEGLVQ